MHTLKWNFILAIIHFSITFEALLCYLSSELVIFFFHQCFKKLMVLGIGMSNYMKMKGFLGLRFLLETSKHNVHNLWIFRLPQA